MSICAARSPSPILRTRRPFTTAMLLGAFWSVSGVALAGYLLRNPGAADLAFPLFMAFAGVVALCGILMVTLARKHRARVFLMSMCVVGMLPLLTILRAQAQIAMDRGAWNDPLLTVFVGAGLLLQLASFIQLGAAGSRTPRRTKTRLP